MNIELNFISYKRNVIGETFGGKKRNLLVDDECEEENKKSKYDSENDDDKIETEEDRDVIDDSEFSYDESINFHQMCDNKMIMGINNLLTVDRSDDENDEDNNQGEFDFNDDIELNNLLGNLSPENEKVKIDHNVKKRIDNSFDKFKFSCQKYCGTNEGECFYYSLLHAIVYELAKKILKTTN